jgi:hypothetical protein
MAVVCRQAGVFFWKWVTDDQSSSTYSLILQQLEMEPVLGILYHRTMLADVQRCIQMM